MQSVHLQTGVIWAQRPITTLDVVPEQLMRAHSLTVLTPSLSNKLPYCAKAGPEEPTHNKIYVLPSRAALPDDTNLVGGLYNTPTLLSSPDRRPADHRKFSAPIAGVSRQRLGRRR